MNLVDALVIKNLSRVGDDSVVKIIKFTQTHGISSLEDLSKVDLLRLPLNAVPLSLKELLEHKNFESARYKVKSDLANWHSRDVEVVMLGTESYPRQLLCLEKPPPFLFCKGNLELLKKRSAITVIGTRNNTHIGERIALKTVEKFAKNGFMIVSGLALGIDTISHRAALDFNTTTIAVLVDLEIVSPSSNRDLADAILDKDGLWIAENPPGTKIIPAYFAKRDRIQAALSQAVFAIETSPDGGTMHAVNTALSIGRPIFVPDASAAGYPDLTIKAISGTQQLVRDQIAVPYTRESYDSILSQLKDVPECVEADFQQGLFL